LAGTLIKKLQFRLIAINAALELATLVTSLDGQLLKIRSKQRELIMHLLSAWHWGQKEEIMVNVNLPVAFVAVWASLLRREAFNGVSVSLLRDWIFPKFAHPLLAYTAPATEADADFAANVYLGGPLPRVVKAAPW